MTLLSSQRPRALTEQNYYRPDCPGCTLHVADVHLHRNEDGSQYYAAPSQHKGLFFHAVAYSESEQAGQEAFVCSCVPSQLYGHCNRSSDHIAAVIAMLLGKEAVRLVGTEGGELFEDEVKPDPVLDAIWAEPIGLFMEMVDRTSKPRRTKLEALYDAQSA